MAEPFTSASPDGSEYEQTGPVPAKRSDRLYLAEERQQSGGLSDDPTKSGDPVKVRRSFKNLKGGR